MKKLIYALLISLVVFAAPSFAAPNWKYAGTVNGNKFYVDINSISIFSSIPATYNAKIVPGGTGKKAFAKKYGQSVGYVIDEWRGDASMVLDIRKVYNTRGKLIRQEEEPKVTDTISNLLYDYVDKFATDNKMFEKLKQLEKKHKNSIVKLYSTGKVEIQSLQ